MELMPSNHLILCCPLLLPSIFLSMGLFSMSHFFASGGQILELQLQHQSLLMHIQCWVSFRIDGFVLCAVLGTLKSLLQHHNSKALILWHSAFFMVQLSHPCMITGKTIALTIWIWTFIGKVLSLLFDMLSRLVLAFLPRSKNLLISWLRSMSAVILELTKIKSATISPLFTSIYIK